MKNAGIEILTKQKGTLSNFLLCFLSASLLVFSFPKLNLSALIWIALLPFLIAIDGKNRRQAFGCGYLTGIIFFGGMFYWIAFITTIEFWVTLLGAVSMVMYLALYFGLFALSAHFFSRLKLSWRLVVLPSCWVVLEFIRAHFLSGFGWASLGHSQFENWVVMQIADVTGVYGISFLIVMMNILVKETIVNAFKASETKTRELQKVQKVVFAVMAGVIIYGVIQLRTPRDWPEVKVAVIQPNVPQEIKWDPSERETIVHKQLEFSRRVALRRPDLIIWPETSFPGFIEDDPGLMDEITSAAAELKIPFLIGLIVHENGQYFNSALLIDPSIHATAMAVTFTQDSAQQSKIMPVGLHENEQFSARYDKLHLVPFGEYLPLRQQLPFLNAMVPIEDFKPGKEFTVFQLKSYENIFKASFSVLICFEDTLASLTRKFVKSGAGFLVNMTNDAWFGLSKASTLHLQAAVFRTVESRRSLVRCANTGISGFIDPLGRIIELVTNKDGGKIGVEGVAMAHIPVNYQQTFYTKFGDVFTMLCFVCILFAGWKKSFKHIS